MEEELMRRRLSEARVGRLATADEKGQPHVVPVCFALSGECVYWAVDFKPKATTRLRRLANIAANPAAELVVDSYSEDWNRLWWVRVKARAEVLIPGPEAERALNLLAAKYEQYRARLPEGPVVRLAVVGWRGWSASPGASDGG